MPKYFRKIKNSSFYKKSKNDNENLKRLKEFSEKRAGHILVDPIEKIRSSLSKGVEWYELTITLNPCKRFCKKSRVYGEMYNSCQYNLLSTFIEKECSERGINHITVFEYQDNGNLHSHSVVSHKGFYEKPLRDYQTLLKRTFGHTTLSKIRSEKYLGYILKDVCSTGIDYPPIFKISGLIDSEILAKLPIKRKFRNLDNIKDMERCLKLNSFKEFLHMYDPLEYDNPKFLLPI